MEQTIRMLQNNLKQKDEQILAAALKLKTLTAERGGYGKNDRNLTKIMKNETSSEETTDSSLLKSWEDKVEEDDSKKRIRSSKRCRRSY